MQLTIVIPTYNEAENLPGLVCALMELPLPQTKILVVDDNSPDGTAGIGQNLATKYPGRLQIHQRSGKLGLGTAYICGFRRALEEGADAVAQMDADFSHPPEKLLELMEALQSCDLAMGSRYIPGGGLDQRWPVWRQSLSTFGNIYARRILNVPVRDVTGGFRMWRRETLLKMPLERVRSNGYVFQVEMVFLAHLLGFQIQEIPFYFADRQWGQSKMSLRIQLEAALRVWLVRFAYQDLRAKV